MKTPRLLLLPLALIITAASLWAEDAPEVVAQGSARDTRRTAGIVPSSGLDSQVVTQAARKLSGLVEGTQIYTVAGTGSMKPMFGDNAVLLVEPAPYADIKIGDIIVYRHEGSDTLIVHRIIEKRRNGFWAKGDNNAGIDDELVTEANYKGRVYGILYASLSPDRANLPASGTLMASR